ncbi:MAG: translation initiation factor IF-2 [Tenacibaculum sp.]
MDEGKNLRLNKVLRELNISLERAVEHLAKKGYEIEARPTTKISGTEYQVLLDGFQTDKSKRVASKEVIEEKRKEKEAIRQQLEAEQEKKRIEEAKKETFKPSTAKIELKTIGKINIKTGKNVTPKQGTEKKEIINKQEPIKKTLEQVVIPEKKQKPPIVNKKPVDESKLKIKRNKPASPSKIEKVIEQSQLKKTEKTKSVKKNAEITPENAEKIKTQYKRLDGPKITGQKINLEQFEKSKKKKPESKTQQSNNKKDNDKKRRRRIVNKSNTKVQNQRTNNRGGSNNKTAGRTNQRRRPIEQKGELTEAEVQKQVRETLEKLQNKSSKGRAARYRKDKRDQHRQQVQAELKAQQEKNKVLKVTEFVTVSEVATMMDKPVTDIISACMTLGMMVTMNQRLDAETLQIVAEEFNFKVEFVGAEVEEVIEEIKDKPEELQNRAPIITVMGHVDHGKTSLLDHIRKANVIAGESGGITQHIGAYSVSLEEGQKITFLDTPGHEAFTAMRARGAQVTDLVIIVIAADDSVMPQTKEAIAHAQAAGVPIIFAINKVDKPEANPDAIKTQLSNMNLLVEDWGGNIQSQEISAKTGKGVNELLEKVLLEAEILELKANPNKNAVGTVVEAQLDKGRGYVSTILVQAGTLQIGHYLLAGKHSGKVRAMFDERGNKIKIAGPSKPVSILGLDGAPQAGDKFNVFDDEREAKQIAIKRSQLQREQSVRTQKTLTLDEIGRRIALGDFKELNIILKGDVDGSVEALTDSFQKLSTEEIQVNIIHKGVGAITESDVLLASASNAIIIGFNVRPQGNARNVADKEEVEIKTYSIIYDAINNLKEAMEGMLSPEMKEELLGNVEIREVYKISKIGNIAGCMVMTGKITKNAKVRIIRNGIVVHQGELASLKRFKDDVKEVTKGYDCGLQIKNFNDIKVEDTIEAYTEIAVKKKL